MEMTTFTEEEAKTKSCPYTIKYCEGSKCMKWRWYYSVKYEKDSEFVLSKPILIKTNRGFCGV